MKQSNEELRLAEFRALREESWRLLRADLTRLQHDLEGRGIGDRIRDRIGSEAHEVLEYAREVASENRGIVAAMIAALVAWALRGPIASVFGSRSTGDEEHSRGENVEADRGEDR